MTDQHHSAHDRNTTAHPERQAHADRVTIAGHEAQRVLDVKLIERLTAQTAADTARIEVLETQARVDQEIIRTLTEQGVLDRNQIANLEIALINARKIGAAIGIVMSTNRVDELAAFDLLRTVSQRTHRKLREVADTVLYIGALDRPLASKAV